MVGFPQIASTSVHEVTITDTLTGKRRPVEATGGVVGIYACGPTVYSRIHVGNARPYVVPMLLRRFLGKLGHRVRLVINVTDINDKIYDAAREAGVPSDRLAVEMTQAYVADTDRLGLGRPDAEPRATDCVPAIVALIAELVERGHAYPSGGDVYFRVRSFPDYGKLSNQEPADMDQGEETGSAELKEDPLDFALWKRRKAAEDTAWPSPWGEGRPGWHIECSAMAEAQLGATFSIHAGGTDLVFPHHENEIAQTEAARGVPLARIWMHNGMVRLAEEKMSKSAGNIFQLSEALDRFGREAVLAYLTSGHYRQPLEFSEEALEQASARNERIRNFVRAARASDAPTTGEDGYAATRLERFLGALADDYNTPRAQAELFELIAEGNRRPVAGAVEALGQMLELLGLESLLEAEREVDEEAERLAAEREEARRQGDFERADRLRDDLADRGWEVRDTPHGPRLVRA